MITDMVVVMRAYKWGTEKEMRVGETDDWGNGLSDEESGECLLSNQSVHSFTSSTYYQAVVGDAAI